jgi:hypothetical protein
MTNENFSRNNTVFGNNTFFRNNSFSVGPDLTKLPTTGPIQNQILQIFLTGRGIAVNPDDKLDFGYIRVTIGRVLVSPLNITANSSSSPDLEVRCINVSATGTQRCYTLVMAGLLYFDNDRYTIRDIDVDNDSATASVYQNDSEVGSLAVVKVVRLDTNIWVGTLEINDTDYYAYILGTYDPLEVEPAAANNQTGLTVQNYKGCGPKIPSVNATDISECRKNGGRMYIGRDENGCPMAPTCLSANCTAVTPMTSHAMSNCTNSGGRVAGGVDYEGCPVTPRCILATGETVEVG